MDAFTVADREQGPQGESEAKLYINIKARVKYMGLAEAQRCLSVISIDYFAAWQIRI